MLYIILISLASIAIVHILSKKNMRVALIAYSLAYVTLIVWSALLIGVSIYTDAMTRYDVMGIGEAFTTSFIDAVNTLSMLSGNTLVILAGAEIAFAIVVICWLFLCGREIHLAIRDYVRNRAKTQIKKSDKLVVYIPTTQERPRDKIYLRLCRLHN